MNENFLTFCQNKKYKNELEFSLDLSKFLNNKTVTSGFEFKKNPSKCSHIITKHNKINNGNRPDIEVKLTEQPINLKWRNLSNPFYIECKMKKVEVLYSLSQLIRYKYKVMSEKHKKMEKYGDFHILVVTPEFLMPSFNAHGFFPENDWLKNFQFTRTLWHLGLGIMFLKQNEDSFFKCEFNEQEELYIR